MTKDSGANPALAKAEPASRLGPSGFDPGEFAVCPFDDRLARTPYLVLPKLALQAIPLGVCRKARTALQGGE